MHLCVGVYACTLNLCISLSHIYRYTYALTSLSTWTGKLVIGVAGLLHIGTSEEVAPPCRFPGSAAPWHSLLTGQAEF